MDTEHIQRWIDENQTLFKYRFKIVLSLNMHYLREVDYEDGYSTCYCCMIDKKDASLNTPCRHIDLFNKSAKIIKQKHILKE